MSTNGVPHPPPSAGRTLDRTASEEECPKAKRHSPDLEENSKGRWALRPQKGAAEAHYGTEYEAPKGQESLATLTSPTDDAALKHEIRYRLTWSHHGLT